MSDDEPDQDPGAELADERDEHEDLEPVDDEDPTDGERAADAVGHEQVGIGAFLDDDPELADDDQLEDPDGSSDA